VQEAGASAIVLEMVPAQLAKLVTDRLSVPTIGIGAGVHTGGQVLVWHDVLGLYPQPPRFVRQYDDLSSHITNALRSYVQEVEDRRFPAEEHSTLLRKENWLRIAGELGEPHLEETSSACCALPPSASLAPHTPAPGAPLSSPASSSPVSPLPRTAPRFAVLGGGSLGSLMAARLALSEPTTLVSSHEAHLRAIRSRGLSVECAEQSGLGGDASTHTLVLPQQLSTVTASDLCAGDSTLVR
jgi:Ketopantoate hydroxymethyltransferase/Ketopantoate reductase PanE/ApbA